MAGNNTTSKAADEPVKGVWLTSNAKRFVLRDSPDNNHLDPSRQMEPGRIVWFFNFRAGRFRNDPDVSEVNDPPPSGAELAKIRAADEAQRRAKLAREEEIADQLPRPRGKDKPARTAAQVLADRRAAEVGDARDEKTEKPRDPAAQP